MATEVVGVTQADGTVRTKGEPNGRPWICDECNGTRIFQPLTGEEGDSSNSPCANMKCSGHLYPDLRVTRRVSMYLPTDSAVRKNIPLATGVLDYFPAALAEIAKLSKAGNDKHNPGQDLHWSRGKSDDHADCIARHLTDRGIIDPDDNISHTAKLAWRSLALLQEELEAAGAPMSRASRVAK